MNRSTPRMQQNSQMRQQWDSNTQLEYNPISHSYSQGHKVNPSIQSLSQEQIADVDPKLQSHEQDMEIGYEDNKPCKFTFEGLEQKLLDEMMKIINDQNNLENEEIARHKQKMVEINTRYQEKLSSTRVHHAAQIGEFLRKESQARLGHHQHSAVNTCQTERSVTDPRDFGWSVATEAQAPPPSGTMPNDSYQDHPQYHGTERGRSSEGGVPYPHGRVYNSSGAQF